MSKRLKQAFVIITVAIVAAQLVRPNRVNPPTDPSRTLRTSPGIDRRLVAVLDRGCRDCHSNDTVWPSLSGVAPLSWLMASGVAKGRQAVNFSEWGAYSPDVQRLLLSASCDDVSSGKMPGIYTVVRPETKLSPNDVETICTAARQAQAQMAGGSK